MGSMKTCLIQLMVLRPLQNDWISLQSQAREPLQSRLPEQNSNKERSVNHFTVIITYDAEGLF